ncbi:MAG TPA: hypothetical protein VNO81_02495, partial [Candidatus Nitrosotenuis sp.]|nr:hypothetical protein [Candidatus Nitrosotenuis sp.]
MGRGADAMFDAAIEKIGAAGGVMDPRLIEQLGAGVRTAGAAPSFRTGDRSDLSDEASGGNAEQYDVNPILNGLGIDGDGNQAGQPAQGGKRGEGKKGKGWGVVKGGKQHQKNGKAHGAALGNEMKANRAEQARIAAGPVAGPKDDEGGPGASPGGPAGGPGAAGQGGASVPGASGPGGLSGAPVGLPGRANPLGPKGARAGRNDRQQDLQADSGPAPAGLPNLGGGQGKGGGTLPGTPAGKPQTELKIHTQNKPEGLAKIGSAEAEQQNARAQAQANQGAAQAQEQKQQSAAQQAQGEVANVQGQLGQTDQQLGESQARRDETGQKVEQAQQNAQDAANKKQFTEKNLADDNKILQNNMQDLMKSAAARQKAAEGLEKAQAGLQIAQQILDMALALPDMIGLIPNPAKPPAVAAAQAAL